MSETVDDYMPNTPDLNQERLELLKKECPDWFTAEGQLDINELKKVLNPNKTKQIERFEFTWFGKEEAKRIAFTPSNLTLKYDEERSVNPGLSEGNIIIEGENSEALKQLLPSYRDKIDCIYFDPPYNKDGDYVYSDDFKLEKHDYWEKIGVTSNGIKLDSSSEAEGRFHSKWLSMIYCRLLIARHLLSETGVIFISIDDNEVHHLRKICDEVFGEENFFSQIVIQSNKRGQTYKQISKTHEYVLVYTKNPDTGVNELDKDSEEMDYQDAIGNFEIRGLRNRNPKFGRFNRPNLFYPFYVDPNSEDKDGFHPISLSKTKKYASEVIPLNSKNEESCWRWGKQKAQKNINSDTQLSDLVAKKKMDGDFKIYEKYRKTTYKAKSIWFEKGVITEKGTVELGKLDLADVFDFPKPIFLIEKILKIGMPEDGVVLDFFAGSGTTGHATLKLNQEDQGNRKFILIQLPELTGEDTSAYKRGFKKISDVTIERNKRVIEGYSDEQDSIDSGFKVYKLSKSNFPRVEFSPDPSKSEEENVEALKKYIAEKESSMETMFNKQDIIDEVLLKNGFMLDYTLSEQPEFEENEVYLATDDHRKALICLDKELSEKTVEHFKGNDDLKFICLERALNTSKKWNLKHYLGDKLNAM